MRDVRQSSEWRRLRQTFARHLATVGPLVCRRCGGLVSAGDKWDLGHPEGGAVVEGGDVEDLWPEHRACNQRAGGALRVKRARERRRARAEPTPSREW